MKRNENMNFLCHYLLAIYPAFKLIFLSLPTYRFSFSFFFNQDMQLDVMTVTATLMSDVQIRHHQKNLRKIVASTKMALNIHSVER